MNHSTEPVQQKTRLGSHAVVIGGSIGGMMTARVLSDFFERVTILERDPVGETPEPRKGQPQARHLHGLLAGGRETMETLYPGMTAEVVAAGGMTGDMGETMIWHVAGGWRLAHPTGITGLVSSRPLLELCIRRRTLALPNISLLDETAVQDPIWSEDRSRAVGVRFHRRGSDTTETLACDLLVDNSGRGSMSPKWLEAAGYGRPAESIVKINVSYATRIFEAWPSQLPQPSLVMIGAEAGKNHRGGMLFPIEGGRWIVTLVGRGGEKAPTDDTGFLAFAASLEAPLLYDLIRQAKPLSGITPHGFPSSLRRHYDRMARFPENYLVIGDAVCSFNPIYGQGMTTAAMQAKALQTILQERGALAGIARPFFAAVDKVLAVPWKLTVGEDYSYPTTEGERPRMVGFINRYVRRVHKATHTDTVVYDAFLKVMNLQAPPESLFAPPILRRVLFGRRSRAAVMPVPVPVPTAGD